MRHRMTRTTFWRCAILHVATFVFVAHAGALPVFDIAWFTLDGGGGTSSGGAFVLSGTIGQPDAGVLTAGSFELTGGYWGTQAAGVAGDCNGDGLIDLNDYACFADCLLGPAQGLLPGCEPFDSNGDGHVDLRDVGFFQTAFDG